VAQERLFAEVAGTEAGPAPAAVPTRPEQARIYRPVRSQMEFVQRDLDSAVAEDHSVRAIWDLVDSLDLSAFYTAIKSIEGGPGHPATDPRVLVALWMYASVEGVGSARELDRLCREHDAYRWLRGGVPINYHLLADFRVQHGAALESLMSQVLAAMMDQGLATLKRVSQDGMRVRTSAGAGSFRRQERLEEYLAQAQEQIRLLAGDVDQPERPASKRERAARKRAARERQERIERALAELPALQAAKKSDEQRQQARASTTDAEARVMKMADGGFRPAYNLQLATDTESQVIVGVSVTNRGTDADEAPPMLEQVIGRCGAKPDDYLIDGGLATLRSVETLTEAGVTVYAPTRVPRGTTRTQAEPRATDTPGVAAWRARMATEEAQTIYRERAATSERVNAQFRQQQGLRQFVVRGLSKVLSVALWMAIAHNLLRWIALTRLGVA